MPRLVITLDVHNHDPKTTDPHELVDGLLALDLPTFSPGRSFASDTDVQGSYVSAEWTS